MWDSNPTLPNAMSHHSTPLPLARLTAMLVTLVTAMSVAHAQAPAPADTAQPVPAESPAAARSERIERITHEDELSRVDELRVGGQTRSIEVTPKNGAPSYEIAPAPGGANLSEGKSGNASTGKSRWRILNF
jgi:hypothetical protein